MQEHAKEAQYLVTVEVHINPMYDYMKVIVVRENAREYIDR